MIITKVILEGVFRGSLLRQVESWSDHRTDAIANLTTFIREGIWPNGKLANPISIPNEYEQDRISNKALEMFKNLLPPQAVRILGRSHANLIAERFHELVHYHTLSKSVTYEVADVLIEKLFPENKF